MLNEKKALLYLCILLNPSEVNNACIFNMENLEKENEFYEIKHVNQMLAFSESVVIGGKRTQVRQIMVYKMSWLRTNYLDPLIKLKRECDRGESSSDGCCTLL